MVLREVLAIVSILVLLTFIATPAMFKLKTGREALLCLNNFKQLGVAWQLYAEENSGTFVQNFHGFFLPTDPRNSPWAAGWLDWTVSPDNTNTLFLLDEKYARLSSFLPNKVNVFKCPADKFLSSAQRIRGWKERVRSVAMSITIGGVNGQTGPWEPIYKQARSMSDLIHPSPAESMVFLDEHPNSINDIGFFAPRRSNYIDAPASYHARAGNFHFADGHAQTHGWKRSALPRNVPVMPNSSTFFFRNQPQAGDPDLSWVSYHSQRVGKAHY
jgi:hypothetical protein